MKKILEIYIASVQTEIFYYTLKAKIVVGSKNFETYKLEKK